jgi:hypothetical protein
MGRRALCEERSRTSTHRSSRPDGWRQFALFVLATELGAVGLAMWLIGAIASWIDHDHAPLWLGFLFVGMVLISAAACCHARISRRELRPTR